MARLAISVGLVAGTLLLVALAQAAPVASADRGPEDLSLSGTVRTGDGQSFVRAASVTLQLYAGSRTAENLTFTGLQVSGDDGSYAFTVPAADWERDHNATLLASYPLVGASGRSDFALSGATAQLRDVALAWNRTLGMGIAVESRRVATARDALATFVINVTNEGNDTDAVLLLAVPEDAGVTAQFSPSDRVELAPGRSQLRSLLVQGDGQGAGDHDISVSWYSPWFTTETGRADLVWEVVPEVLLSVQGIGISWWPDPLFDGDQALLNCTVANGGRDVAVGANVTVALTHPALGEVLRDRVRLDVPALGSVVASFPWRAVYSESDYTLRFEVEHPLDIGHGDDAAEVPMSVGVHNTPPTVAFISPTEGARLTGIVTVRLSVTDPDAASGANGTFVRVDGGPWQSLALPSPTYRWDTTTVADGWHALEAYATDRYSSSPVVPMTVKVENSGPNSAPVALVEAPVEGDVFESLLWAKGTSYDPDPSDAVERVEARIDDGAWAVAEGTAHWTFEHDTSGLAEGAHALSVRAFDGIDPSEPVTVNFTVTRQGATALVLELEVFPVSALPSEIVELRGSVAYDNGVRARSVVVRLSGQGVPTGRTVNADVRGEFTDTITAPADAGDYTYIAQANDGTGKTASGQADLTVIRPVTPDLMVASIALEGELRAVGVNITVGVEVRNLGTGQASCNLTAWEGEPGQGRLVVRRSITVYDVLDAAFVWAPSRTGGIDLWVALEDIRPMDTNSSNDRRFEPVTVLDPPDVALLKLVPSNLRPYEGLEITVSAALENSGGINATCDVELFLDDTNDTSRIGMSTDVLVPAGGSGFATFDWVPVKGSHTLIARVRNVHPGEARPDNNEVSRQLEVAGPYEPEPDDEQGFLPGPAAPSVVAAIAGCAAAVALAGARRRRRGAP